MSKSEWARGSSSRRETGKKRFLLYNQGDKVKCPVCKQQVKLLGNGQWPARHKDSKGSKYAWCYHPHK